METETIVFFSTHCPRCKALEMMLKKKNVNYIENNNVKEMLALGLSSAPALKVGDKVLDFPSAMAWAKEL